MLEMGLERTITLAGWLLRSCMLVNFFRSSTKSLFTSQCRHRFDGFAMMMAAPVIVLPGTRIGC